jgi:hypothetical protein
MLVSCCFLFVCNSLQAKQGVKLFGDTTQLFEKIKQNERQFKLLKQRQLKRIETKDSLIVYGSDKQQTQITIVMVINRHVENKYYWFINNKLFKITLYTWPQKMDGKKRKGKGFYFIENGEVFYKEEKGITKDVKSLLTEADKFLTEGLKILQDQ